MYLCIRIYIVSISISLLTSENFNIFVVQKKIIMEQENQMWLQFICKNWN